MGEQQQGQRPSAVGRAPAGCADQGAPADAVPGVVLLAAVLAAGAGTMTVELAAVRLLAPWFGASAGVWTNVIGVVLLALALGYLLGARLSSGPRPAHRLATLLLAAAVCAAVLPALAAPVAKVFMPTGVPLHEAAELLVWGSLAATAVLFLPAAVLLGAVGPLAVEATQRAHGGGAGRAGGRVLALSTVGSLVGTFGTTHVLIPSLGVRATFLVAAGALFLAGAAVGLAQRRAASVGGGLVLMALANGLAYHPPGAREGETELAAVDSPYQRLRVIESGAGDERMRQLRVNESLDSFQSVWSPKAGLLPPGHYYDHFALPLAFEGADGPPAKWRVLILGLGAGTTVRVLEGVVDAATQLDIVGIEIDPVVLALGEAHFDLRPGPGREYIGGLDARVALALTQGEFDQVVLDAYANNMEIPPHLATREFFGAVARVLRPGGWLTANVGGFGAEDPVVSAVSGTAASALGVPVQLARVPFSRNVTLLARISGDVPTPGSAGWRFAPGLDELRPALEVPGAWSTVRPGSETERREDTPPVLTDDLCPLDWLQLRSIREARERWLARS